MQRETKSAAQDGPISLSCAVLTVSDRRGADQDTSGDYLSTSLQEAGHLLRTRAVCADNIYQIRKVLSDWIADPAIHVILVNGGTGYAHGKSTVAASSVLFDRTISGFGELFRHLSWSDIGSSALQSDAIAGTANGTLVFCMPGSTGACRLAWTKIIRTSSTAGTVPATSPRILTSSPAQRQGIPSAEWLHGNSVV